MPLNDLMDSARCFVVTLLAIVGLAIVGLACTVDYGFRSADQPSGSSSGGNGAAAEDACDLVYCVDDPDAVGCVDRCLDDPAVEGCWPRCVAGQREDCWLPDDECKSLTDCAPDFCLDQPGAQDCVHRCEDDPGVDGCWYECEDGQDVDCWDLECS